MKKFFFFAVKFESFTCVTSLQLHVFVKRLLLDSETRMYLFFYFFYFAVGFHSVTPDDQTQ